MLQDKQRLLKVVEWRPGQMRPVLSMFQPLSRQDPVVRAEL